MKGLSLSCLSLALATIVSGAIAIPSQSQPNLISHPEISQGDIPILNPPIKRPPILRDPTLKPIPELQRPIRICTDPAAERIEFTIVRRDTQFRGQVRITGVIKNRGLADYESQPNQQAMYLYENGTLVKTQAFQNLASGASAQISYERTWNASSPAEGEFPPTYRLLISYDPDIRIDDNPKNDDCVTSNNQLERSGTGINDLFR